jgi:DNA-binding transcriptional MerR regulator
MHNKIDNDKQNPLTQVLSVREAADLYGVSPRTILYHIDKGHLTFRQIEKGIYLIDIDSLNRLSQRLHGKMISGLESECICFQVF